MSAGRQSKQVHAGVIASVLMSSSRSSTREVHREVELAAQLPADELRILGQNRTRLPGVSAKLRSAIEVDRTMPQRTQNGSAAEPDFGGSGGFGPSGFTVVSTECGTVLSCATVLSV